MSRDRVVSDEPIDLDPNELLGLSQIAKVSEGLGKPGALGQVLSKVGTEGPPLPDWRADLCIPGCSARSAKGDQSPRLLSGCEALEQNRRRRHWLVYVADGGVSVR